MTTLTECDRCKTIDRGTDSSYMKIDMWHGIQRGIAKDLCKKCQKEFYKWMENG